MNEAKPWTPPADSSDGARGPVPTVEEAYCISPGQLCSEAKHDYDCWAHWPDLMRRAEADRRAIALDAARRALLRAADEAEQCEYPHPQDMLDKSGRGRFYQQNITGAWRQAGHHMARRIRALAREPERVLEEGE